MDQVFLEIVGEIAKEQLPKLTDKALAKLAKEESIKDNPLMPVVVKIARNWNKEHGAEATGTLLGQLEQVMKGDEKDLIALAAKMNAADLTALTDALQSAEAKHKRVARENTVKLGRHLARFGRIFSRALMIAAMGA